MSGCAHITEEVVEAIDCNLGSDDPRDLTHDHVHLVPQHIKYCPIFHVRVQPGTLFQSLPDIAEKTVAATSTKYEVWYRSQRTGNVTYLLILLS